MSEKKAPTPLRVGIVTTSFPVPSNPSSGIFVHRLVSNLSREIRPVVVFPCPQINLGRKSDETYDLDCFRYAPRRWMRLTHRPGGIPDALRRRDPAIVLIPVLIAAMFLACLKLAGRVDVLHGNWSLPGLVAACAARLRGRPAITTLRGEDISRAERSTVDGWILSACLALNQRIVVVSESMRDLLRQRFPRHARRIEFVPNGADVRAHGERVGLHAPLRLLTVGSLIRRKRIDIMLHALAGLNLNSSVVLRIVGDGPERDALEALGHELELKGNLEFTGSVPPDEIEKHLEWADLFLFSSESEGRPNAVLEAMAAGLPVIASDIPGVRELLHPDAGLLFEVGDTDGLIQAIDALGMDAAAAHSLGRAAKRRMESGLLTWAATASQYETIYREVARQAALRPCAD